MGLRETLNNNPIVAVAFGALAVVLVGWMLLGRGRGDGDFDGSTPPETRQYFTVDDGKTLFADSFTRLAPFDKDGKEAVVAHVYRDLDNQSNFVAYLSRVAPEGRKAAEERTRRAAAGEVVAVDGPLIMMEYRRPGEADWIKASDPRAVQLIGEIRSPKGSVNVEPVFPK